MRKSRFPQAQVMGKQAEAGRPVPDLCREHGVTQTTRPNLVDGRQVLSPRDRQRALYVLRAGHPGVAAGRDAGGHSLSAVHLTSGSVPV